VPKRGVPAWPPATGGPECQPGSVFAKPVLTALEPLSEAALGIDIQHGHGAFLLKRPDNRQVRDHGCLSRATFLLGDGNDGAGHSSFLNMLLLSRNLDSTLDIDARPQKKRPLRNIATASSDNVD